MGSFYIVSFSYRGQATHYPLPQKERPIFNLSNIIV